MTKTTAKRQASISNINEGIGALMGAGMKDRETLADVRDRVIELSEDVTRLEGVTRDFISVVKDLLATEQQKVRMERDREHQNYLNGVSARRWGRD